MTVAFKPTEDPETGRRTGRPRKAQEWTPEDGS